MSETFQLHERLAKGGFHLGTVHHCEVLLKNNALYPWFVIVPRIDSNNIDIDSLTESQYDDIQKATLLITKFIRAQFSPDKINIGNIGNIVQQMHIHVIGRFTTDPAWPDVVWGHKDKELYTFEQENTIQHDFNEFLKTWVQKY